MNSSRLRRSVRGPVATGLTPAEQLLLSKRPLVIGHRGYAAFAPENTLDSFRLALSADVDLVELDCRSSRDGVPVVIHDPSLDRTTDARERWGGTRLMVSAHTAAQLSELRAGAWFRPAFPDSELPTLQAAMDLIQHAGATLIERKSGDPGSCVNLLRRNGWMNRAVVQAFDWEYLRAYHRLEPAQVLGALGPPSSRKGKRLARRHQALGAAWLDEIREVGCRLAVWNRQVSAAAVTAAHRRGLKVWVYTVDDLRTAGELFDSGVDGIISNNPAVIWKAVAGLMGRR